MDARGALEVIDLDEDLPGDRVALADLLPAEISARPKQPYRAPISACFPEGGTSLAARMLSDETIGRSPLLNAPAIKALLTKARNDRFPLSERDEMAVATMTSLQLIQHLFVDQFDPARTREASRHD